MELTINVDETMFKEVLEKELKAFSEEEIKQIIREGLIKCMSNVDTFKDLFIVEEKENSWSNNYRVELKKVAYEAAKTIDYSPLFNDFKEKVITYIKDNGQKIIKDMMLDLFIGGLQNSLLYQNKAGFMDILRTEISIAIQQDKNNNNEY